MRENILTITTIATTMPAIAPELRPLEAEGVSVGELEATNWLI